MSSKEKGLPWLPLFVLSFAYGAAYNAPYIRYFLYDPMREAMKCSNMELGLLATVMAVASMLCQIPGGWIADKFGIKKILIISLCADFPLVVISVIFVDIYPVQLAVWICFAFAVGFAFWAAVLKGIRLLGREKGSSMTFGIFGAMEGTIAALINLLAVEIFSRFENQVTGYRMAHLLMGACCLVGAVLVGVFFKEEEILGESQEEKEKFHIRDTLQLLKNPNIYFAAVLIFAIYGLSVSQSYMTPYFTGILGAGLAFTGVFAIIRDYGIRLVGGPLGGRIAAGLRSATKLNVLCLLMCACLIFIISRLDGGMKGIVAAAAVLVLLNAFACSMAKSTMWGNLDDAGIPMKLTGTAIALITPVAINLPDAVLPPLNGWLLDTFSHDLPRAYGYYFAILIAMALTGAAAGMAIILGNRRKKKARTDDTTL